MENLRNKLRRIKSELYLIVDQEDIGVMGEFGKILSWEHPIYTLIIFFILNQVLWMIAYFRFSTLTIISFFILINFVYDYFIGSKPRAESPPPRYRRIYNEIVSDFSLFRQEYPLEFCFLMSVFFLILTYTATIFSGIMMCFIFLWAMFFIPLLYANMPPDFDEKVRDFVIFLRRIQGNLQEDDLLPPPIEYENRADDNEDIESLDTERTADSITSSLISGITSMPSFLDAEDNHEILEEDLIPINPSQNDELSPSLAELSSDSESELNDLRFKESQFSRENSSDEEGNFEEGLHFEDTQNKTLPESRGLVHNIVDYVTSTSGFQLPNFLSNAMTSMQSTEKKDISIDSSTSEDDFEIIDADELKQ